MNSANTTRYTLCIKPDNDCSDSVLQHYMSFSSHHLGDSGIDLMTPSSVSVGFLDVGTINFKIRCEMRDNKTGSNVSYLLIPRSSIVKTSFQMANSIGLIDAGYRGNIMAKIRGFSQVENIAKENQMLFQICAPDLSPLSVQLVESLSETTRGEGGFGSTNTPATVSVQN